MNKKIYQPIGVILNKEKDKVGNKESLYYGKPCYKLKAKLENQGLSKIEVYENLVSSRIWETIEKNKFLDKRYLFQCHNYFGTYRLIDWEELRNDE